VRILILAACTWVMENYEQLRRSSGGAWTSCPVFVGNTEYPIEIRVAKGDGYINVRSACPSGQEVTAAERKMIRQIRVMLRKHGYRVLYADVRGNAV